MTPERLTSTEYWDRGYGALALARPVDPRDYRQLGDRRILELLERIGIAGKRVLEIGAGNSGLLTYLARTHAGTATFTGLDYSDTGCRLLRDRAAREGAALTVVQADLFAPPPELIGAFDVIYTIGVVEHFADLPAVLKAIARFGAPGAAIVTEIPNMAGLLGDITRRWNRGVYELHVPHDRASLVKGHADAGIRVERAGYLCSQNFNVLSSCFTSPRDRLWRTYLLLSRLTKAIWRLEALVGDLPHTAWLSPYIFVVGRVPAA